jgi:hypothetical protein
VHPDNLRIERQEYHMPEASRFIPASALALLLAAGPALAQEASRHLAPGFTVRAAQSKLVVMPAEMELFSISAGGIQEPRADWTEAAQKNFKAALLAKRAALGANVIEMSTQQADEFAPILSLHGNVAESIFYHHASNGPRLPTKDGRLDWTLGEAVRPLKEKTGADYALFTWIRDSYASGERKAAMVALALLGSITLGGEQVGYASLVDLNTGRVVWFNDLVRMSGDLREPQPAEETVDTLLKGFPGVK